MTTKGGYAGHIRYIGHVDKIDQSNVLFVGLEMETAGKVVRNDIELVRKLHQCLVVNLFLFPNDLTIELVLSMFLKKSVNKSIKK